MNETDYNIAKELKSRISGITRVLDFKIFGSRARNNAGSDSDLDIYIEVKSIDDTLKDSIRHVAWEIGFEHSVYISVLIFTHDEITNSPLRSSPLVENIERQGISI